MGAFKYEGFNREGKKISGEIEGKTLVEVKKLLRRDGIRATKVQAPSIFDQDLNQMIASAVGSTGFSVKDLNRFTKQLATLIDAGVSILQSLEVLHKQEKIPGLKRAILNISRSVGDGKSLNEAMSAEKGFNRLYCQLIKAGETAGILDSILVKLSEFMEKGEALKRKIKGALTYPTVVVLVGITVVSILLTFVVPQFVSMLTESGQEIPFITQLVIDVSDFFANNALLIFGGVVVLIFSFIYITKTPQGKEVYDLITMKLPIFGEIIIKGNLSAFAHTLSTMLSSGIPIIDALDICAETLDNKIIAKDISKVRDAVIGGKSMTAPLKRITYFPELVAQMIEVGESTGSTDEMLNKVAKVFELEVESAIEAMTQLIEPLILVVLGGIIGVVLVAMYLPVFLSAGGIG